MDSTLQEAFDRWEASFNALCRYLNDATTPTPASTPATTAGDVTEPVTPSSVTTEFVLASAGLAEPPAPAPSIVTPPVVAPATPIDIAAVVPVTFSTECAAQAVTVSTSATNAVPSSVAPAFSLKAGARDDPTPSSTAPIRCSTYCSTGGSMASSQPTQVGVPETLVITTDIVNEAHSLDQGTSAPDLAPTPAALTPTMKAATSCIPMSPTRCSMGGLDHNTDMDDPMASCLLPGSAPTPSPRPWLEPVPPRPPDPTLQHDDYATRLDFSELQPDDYNCFLYWFPSGYLFIIIVHARECGMGTPKLGTIWDPRGLILVVPYPVDRTGNVDHKHFLGFDCDFQEDCPIFDFHVRVIVRSLELQLTSVGSAPIILPRVHSDGGKLAALICECLVVDTADCPGSSLRATSSVAGYPQFSVQSPIHYFIASESVSWLDTMDWHLLDFSCRSVVTVCLSYPQELVHYFCRSQLNEVLVLDSMRRSNSSYDQFCCAIRDASYWPGHSVTGKEMNIVFNADSRGSHWLMSCLCDSPAISSSIAVLCDELVLPPWDPVQQTVCWAYSEDFVWHAKEPWKIYMYHILQHVVVPSVTCPGKLQRAMELLHTSVHWPFLNQEEFKGSGIFLTRCIGFTLGRAELTKFLSSECFITLLCPGSDKWFFWTLDPWSPYLDSAIQGYMLISEHSLNGPFGVGCIFFSDLEHFLWDPGDYKDCLMVALVPFKGEGHLDLGNCITTTWWYFLSYARISTVLRIISDLLRPLQQSGDTGGLSSLVPCLSASVQARSHGTRHGIHELTTATVKRTAFGMEQGRNDTAIDYALVPWDPGEVSPSNSAEDSAWGQAEFQGGRDVRSLSLFLPIVYLGWLHGLAHGPGSASTAARYLCKEGVSAQVIPVRIRTGGGGETLSHLAPDFLLLFLLSSF